MTSVKISQLPSATAPLTGNELFPLVQLGTTSKIAASAIFSSQLIGQGLYPRTTAEITAGVTPTYYGYPPGDVRRYGATGDGTTDDTVAVQKAFTVAQVAGGLISIPRGAYRITSSITLTNAGGIVVQGEGAGLIDTVGSVLVCDTGSSNGFIFSNVDGAEIADLRITGSNVVAGNLVAITNGSTNVTFRKTRIVNGYNGVLLQHVNTVRFIDTTISTFNGEQCVFLNGVSDVNRADPVEFTNCAVSAGAGNDNTDNVVVDGLGGSLKFVSCFIGFGRNGVWFKNTTGENPPRFLYVCSGGFENGMGTPVKMDAGSKIFINGAPYISSDGYEPNIWLGPNFEGEAMISAYIRGAGRDGILAESGYVTVVGSRIVNNGRFSNASFSENVLNVTNNGSGLIRITTAVNNYRTGDRVRIASVGGATEANGDWEITQISTTQFDLIGSTYSSAYTSGGTVHLLAYGIRTTANAQRVLIAGNSIGTAGDSPNNNQDYGILIAGDDSVIENNEIYGSVTGDVLDLANSKTNRVKDNTVPSCVDGWISHTIAGTVSNGTVPITALSVLVNKKIRIISCSRAIESGTSVSVNLTSPDTTVGLGSVSATTTLANTNYTSPAIIDARAAPIRLTLTTTGATGTPANLTVSFAYQIIS